MDKLQLLYANGSTSLGIDSEGNEHRYDRTAGDIISGWCMMHGSTMRGRQDACRQIFGWHQKVPVLISEISQEIWFPIAGERAEDNVWICYDGVFSFHRNSDCETGLSLVCGLEADITCNVRTVRMQMKRCEQLCAYLNETVRDRHSTGLSYLMNEKKD